MVITEKRIADMREHTDLGGNLTFRLEYPHPLLITPLEDCPHEDDSVTCGMRRRRP